MTIPRMRASPARGPITAPAIMPLELLLPSRVVGDGGTGVVDEEVDVTWVVSGRLVGVALLVPWIVSMRVCTSSRTVTY